MVEGIFSVGFLNSIILLLMEMGVLLMLMMNWFIVMCLMFVYCCLLIDMGSCLEVFWGILLVYLRGISVSVVLCFVWWL